MFGNEQVVIVTPKNAHFEDVSFFIKASDEEKLQLTVIWYISYWYT